MAYGFFLRHSLDLLAILPTPNALAVYTNVAEAVFFALLNQKMTYNRKHQPLFIKGGEWAML